VPQAASTRLPLSALLSQALIAFTIELDNAWESEMPHHTTRYGGPAGSPYAVSLRQWSNFMRVLGDGGLSVRELERRTGAKPQLDGMRRWRYVTIGPDPDDPRPKPPQPEWLVIPTQVGRRAQAVWRPLPDAVEARWRRRFGAGKVRDLRAALTGLSEQVGSGLPEFLTTSYAGWATAPAKRPIETASGPPALSALLSRELHAFALEYEEDAQASLAYCANVLRLLDDEGLPIAQIASRSGIGIDAIRVAVGVLAKRRFISVTPVPGARGRQARLTATGRHEHARYKELPFAIESRWCEQFGAGPIEQLRSCLEALATASGAERAPLWLGLDPPEGSWRSKARRPQVLAHFPMPRQGGHPDGT
jgi:hypothetical protein